MDQQISQAPASMPVASRLPGIGTLFRESFSNYAKRFKIYIAIQAIYLVSFAVIGLIFFGLTLVVESTVSFRLSVIAGRAAAIVAGTLAVIVISFWTQASMLYAMTHTDEQVGIRASLREGWARIGQYFWISFLSGFLVFGALLLFIIPGIIFAVFFAFALMVFMAEGDRGAAAILKSREYARGFWGAVFFRIVLIILVFVILSFILKGAIADIAVQLIVAPFLSIYFVTIYTQLKAVKGQIILSQEQIVQKKRFIRWIVIAGYALSFIAMLVVLLL